MRKIFAGFALTVWGAGAHAQSVSPEVVATAGGYFTSVNAQLSWTLGEPVVDTWSNVTTTLTQGFQQNSYYLNGVEELENEVCVTVYPNPSAGMVNLSLNGTHPYVQAILTDAAGNIVGQQNLAGIQQCHFDLGLFAPGAYILSITDHQQKKQNVTIIKQ